MLHTCVCACGGLALRHSKGGRDSSSVSTGPEHTFLKKKTRHAAEQDRLYFFLSRGREKCVPCSTHRNNMASFLQRLYPGDLLASLMSRAQREAHRPKAAWSRREEEMRRVPLFLVLSARYFPSAPFHPNSSILDTKHSHPRDARAGQPFLAEQRRTAALGNSGTSSSVSGSAVGPPSPCTRRRC